MRDESDAEPSLPTWRVRHQGRAGILYEELHDGHWRSFAIDGEMLTGQPSFVIYFGAMEAWKEAPDWAQGRRGEIIGRIKSVMRIPEYEYTGEAVLEERDWALLVEVAGGVSSINCARQDCSERALRSKRFCVRHANSQVS